VTAPRRRGWLVAVAMVVLAGPAGPARSEVAAVRAAPAADHAAWLSVAGLAGARGLTLGAERRRGRHASLVAALGARQSASGDVVGVTVAAALGARWYHRGRSERGPDGGLAGWFAGPRLELAVDHLRRAGAGLGTMTTVGAVAEGGHRWVPWRRLTVTGLAAVGLRVDGGGGVPARARASVGAGLELGWLF
jgi:hypothetical protein